MRIIGAIALLAATTIVLAEENRLGIGQGVQPKKDQQQQEPQPQQQEQPQLKAQPLQRQAPPPAQPADFYTSEDGMRVRIMKSAGKTATAEAPAKPTQAVKPTAVPSPVYPVKRPKESPAEPVTSYVAPPPRPIVTVSPPPVKKPVGKPDGEAKKGGEEDDEDDENEDENNNNSKTTPQKPEKKKPSADNDGNGKKGGKSTNTSDQWGDFVFPTRSPRPNWVKNAAESLNTRLSLLTMTIGLMIALLS